MSHQPFADGSDLQVETNSRKQCNAVVTIYGKLLNFILNCDHSKHYGKPQLGWTDTNGQV